MILLYSFTLALSAMLMFIVEPVVSKIILPVLGGNPSVWGAVVMFFQGVLLLGYAYVHVGRELLGTKKQALVHAGLLIFSLLFLPLSISPELLHSTVYIHPVAWLISVLMVSVGVPFFVLSASAPLLSSWFAESEKNPYMLYAASNIGSLFGLLSYPFIVEPFLSLSTQRIVWSVCYGLLLAMVSFLLKEYLQTHVAKTKKKIERAVKPISNELRAWWVLLAFVPSSLMLSVTSHITTDIAPIPLLWVVPLALYLLSFVFVFARQPRGIETSRKMLVPFVAPLALMLAVSENILPYWPWLVALPVYILVTIFTKPELRTASIKQIAQTLFGPVLFLLPFVFFFGGKLQYLPLCVWYVAAFFLVSMVCHGRLSELKPVPEELTEYYFFLSLGGAFGGIFNVLIAPLLFYGFYELQLGLIAAFFMLPFTREDWENKRPLLWALGASAFSLLLFYLEYKNLGAFDRNIIEPFNRWMWDKRYEWGNIGFASKSDTFAFFEIVTLMLVMLYFRKNKLVPGVVIGPMLLVTLLFPVGNNELKFQDRNFFGILYARFAPSQPAMYLTNGTTQHGFQFKDEAHARTPTNYYDWEGPLGALVRSLRLRTGGAGQEVAAVGLGTGTVACLAQEGQRTTFFEINPMIDKIAHTPELFSYLRDCPGSNRVVIGDGRISMQSQPDHFFSLIILDAFNSDAIPIHLLTKEALDLYMQKLTPDGVIAYHISNRHLNLEPVVGNLAQTHNLYGISGYFEGSDWVFVAQKPEDFGALADDQRFHLLVPDDSKRLWTDDYSDIISILNLY